MGACDLGPGTWPLQASGSPWARIDESPQGKSPSRGLLLHGLHGAGCLLAAQVGSVGKSSLNL